MGSPAVTALKASSAKTSKVIKKHKKFSNFSDKELDKLEIKTDLTVKDVPIALSYPGCYLNIISFKLQLSTIGPHHLWFP